MKWGRRRARTKVVTVGFLQRHAVPILWQEAVAIVLETGDLVDRMGRSVPRPEAVELVSDGSLALRQGRRRPGTKVAALSAMLQEMLMGHPPKELVAFLSAAGSRSSSLKTVPEFVEALRYYERPGRQEILSEVYARGRTALESAKEEDLVPRPVHGPRTLALRRRIRRLAVAAGVAAVMVGGTVVAEQLSPGLVTGPVSSLTSSMDTGWGQAWARVSAFRESASRDLAAVVERLGDARASLSEATGFDLDPQTRGDAGGVEATSVGDTGPRSDAAEARRPARAGSPATGSSGGRARLPSVAVEVGSEETRPHRLYENSPLPMPHGHSGNEALEAETSVAVFDERDVGVTPPVAVSLTLPSDLESFPVRGRLGAVEVVVSESGEVEHVRLASSVYSLHGAMLLSAVKTWRFDPARKDGTPVRYRHLFPVSVPRSQTGIPRRGVN